MKEINEYLLAKGFIEESDGIFSLIQKQIQQMIINGQPMQNEIEHKLTVKYIGEGECDGEVIHGYTILQNDIPVIDEWVSTLDQFRKIL